MDLFVYMPEYKILICRKCKFAVPPSALKSHLERTHKGDHLDLRERGGPAAVVQEILSREDMPLLDPRQEKLAIPRHKIDAIPFLHLHSGHQCTICPQILCSIKGIGRHMRIAHGIIRRGPGRPSLTSQQRHQDWTTVTCQRLFGSLHQSNYFAVYSPEETKARIATARKAQGGENGSLHDIRPATEEVVRAELFGQLAVHREQHRATSSIVAKEIDKTEASPWLQLTRWATYLSGHSLSDVAKLGILPEAGTEPLLAILCESLDRLVGLAHRSVCEDRINAFDQLRINSFVQRPRAADKPLVVKLQKSTYKRYASIWEASPLLCTPYSAASIKVAAPSSSHSITNLAFRPNDDERGSGFVQQLREPHLIDL